MGGDGDDVLDGGDGRDLLTGGRGDDLLAGGLKGDTFVFRPGFGHDVISDFYALEGGRHDVIAFSKSLFATFGQVADKMSQAGDDVVIKVAADHTLVLEDVLLSDLTADDFAFVS